MYRNALLRKLGEEDAPIDDPWNPKPLPQEPPAPASVVQPPTGFAPGEPDPNGPPPAQAPAKPDYSQWGQYHVAGLDMDKVRSGHNSPKYQFARIQSHFDPAKGYTPEMIEALNALEYEGQKIGNFRGEKDWLHVDNGISKLDGLTGADMIEDFGPGGKNIWHGWGGSGPNAPQASASGRGASMPQMGGMPIDPQLQGDPLDAIQQALARISGNSPHLSALLAQLGR